MSEKLVWIIEVIEFNDESRLVHAASSESKAIDFMIANYELLDDTDISNREPMTNFTLVPAEVNGLPRNDEMRIYDWDDVAPKDTLTRGQKLLQDGVEDSMSLEVRWAQTAGAVMSVTLDRGRVSTEDVSSILNVDVMFASAIIARMVREEYLQHYEGDFYTLADKVPSLT